MKKIISAIISVIMLTNIIPVLAVENNSNLPTEDCEFGFMFSVAEDNFDYENFENVEALFEELNIYFAPDLNALKEVANEYTISYYEENFEIEVPDEPIILDECNEAEVSLFDTDVETFDEINDFEQTGEYYVNDPLFPKQWYHEACNVEAYRNNGITGNGIKVGILDSGLMNSNFDYNYYDFEGVDIQQGLNVCAYLKEDNERLYNLTDGTDHGTGVTSIIAANSNNKIGMSGITDKCTIIPYKIEDGYYMTGGFGLLQGLKFAYKDGCDVVNISYAGQHSGLYYNEVVDYCIQKGMIIIAGAGNDGDNEENLNALSYPAACNNVIGVGAVRPDCDEIMVAFDNETGIIVNPETAESGSYTRSSAYIIDQVRELDANAYIKSDFSTANESVFVAAPGSYILQMSGWGDAMGERRTYAVKGGTSFATPIVTAAAVGVKQMRPYVDVDMFKEILIATSTDLDAEGYDINTGYGLVNFEAIYEYVQEMPETAPEKTPEITVDTENKVLKGFISGDEYTINGVSVVSEDGTIAIDNNWYGTTLEIVKVASADYFTDSEVAYVEVSKLSTTISLVLDYSNNTINGFDNELIYNVNDTPVSPEDGKLTISDEWYGTTLNITANHVEDYYEGAETILIIPAITEAPTTVVGGVNAISGLDDTMEYKNSTSEVWISCDTTKIAGLSAGTYDIRYEYTDNSFASRIAQVEVTSYQEATPVIAIDFINETLTGFLGGEEYFINDETVNPKTTVDITEDMFGTTITIVKKATEDIYTDSEEIEIAIPARPSEAPNASKMYTTFMSSGDTKVYNIVGGINEYEKLEWSKSGDETDTWIKCSGSQIFASPDSTIYFRYRATETTFASEKTAYTLITPTPKPTATPEPTVEPTEEPTPTPTVEPTTAPTETPIATVVPTATPVGTVEPTTMPTATPTVKPTTTPTTTPTVAPTATPVPTDEPADVLEKEYDVETSVRYSKENGRIYFECNNKTGDDVKCVSFVAIYDTNGTLVYIRMIDTLQAGKWTGTHPYSGDVGRVKFFTWKDMSSMQPMDNVQASELVVE